MTSQCGFSNLSPAGPGDDMERAGMARHDFRAMNTEISLACGGPNPGRRLGRAERWLLAYEERFSRFRGSSELSQLNQFAGRPFRASPSLFHLVELALELAHRSQGLFDPTILGALENAGYDRSFEHLSGARRRKRSRPPRASYQQVHLEPFVREISLPVGVGLDLGGIGKGWAVDRLARILSSPCPVNGGGDVFALGVPSDGEKWRVGIANPFNTKEDLLMLSVSDRGIATSSSLSRRWKAGNAVQVTAVAPSSVEADYHAKVALLLGAEQGREYLNKEPAVDGFIIRSDSSNLRTDELAQFL